MKALEIKTSFCEEYSQCREPKGDRCYNDGRGCEAFYLRINSRMDKERLDNLRKNRAFKIIK